MAQDPELRRLVRLASGYNRRAEKLGITGRVTGEDLMAIEEVEGSCRYCGIGLEQGHGSFDHLYPLGFGGKNTPMNIVRCCLSCQRKKHTKTVIEYETHQNLIVSCSVCGKEFKPRWGEYRAGRARVCSRSCSAKSRWVVA